MDEEGRKKVEGGRFYSKARTAALTHRGGRSDFWVECRVFDSILVSSVWLGERARTHKTSSARF